MRKKGLDMREGRGREGGEGRVYLMSYGKIGM